MVNTAHTHFTANGFPRRYSAANGQRTLRSGRQDKPRATTAPRSHATAWNGKNTARARQMDTIILRQQNTPKKHSTSRRKKKVNIWLDPPEMAKLIGKAKSEGLSLSATGAAYIKRGMQEEADLQYSAFLQPVIETLLRNELKRYFSRMILFLARITMTLDVMKGLVRWLCRRIAGATKEQVDAVEERSRTDARINLQSKSPQLERISKELEQTLMEGIT